MKRLKHLKVKQVNLKISKSKSNKTIKDNIPMCPKVKLMKDLKANKSRKGFSVKQINGRS